MNWDRMSGGVATAAEGLKRMFLHARRLAFDHPGVGQRVELEAPLPAECETLLGQLP